MSLVSKICIKNANSFIKYINLNTICLNSKYLSVLYTPKQNIRNFSVSSYHTMKDCYKDKDPAPLFFNDEIQRILKILTGFNLEKTFKNRILENPDSKEEYKFITAEEIIELQKTSMHDALRLLQMPPIVKEREPIEKVLSSDYALEGLLKNKIVFTDISTDINNRDRIIVTRELDGTLQHASWDQRHRMNQMYKPIPGRNMFCPEIFEDKYLKNCLRVSEYMFVLDFACAQFEPDDPSYHSVTSTVYEHINQASQYELLESTRHYGPMCFYFAWNNKIDNLLNHYIHKERLSDCIELIKLHKFIKSNGSSKIELEENDYLQYIQEYIENESITNRLSLLNTLEVYKETILARKNVAAAQKQSHGI